MTVAAVATVYNEADIIEYTMRHLFSEGIDTIYIAYGPSTDNTSELIAPERWHGKVVVVSDGDSPIHYQPKWISHLAQMAYEDGHEWVIPFDADEFWYSLHGDTVADCLDGVRADVVSVPMFRHHDWNTLIEINTLPKVCFRARDGVQVFNGNHDCSIPGERIQGALALREICFRGFEHFKRKTRERNATIDPTLPTGDGMHQRVNAGKSDEELYEAWREYTHLPHRRDPIPSRIQNIPVIKW